MEIILEQSLYITNPKDCFWTLGILNIQQIDLQPNHDQTLREKCPYSEFFWSAFSRIRNEYSRMQTRKTPNTDTFYVMKVVKKNRFTNFSLMLHFFTPLKHLKSSGFFDFFRGYLNGILG